jgi:hypothetical protein
VKLKAGGTSFFLMRLNRKWKDVSFIGGHDKPRDGGSLEKTASRELWEEVPSIRKLRFDLDPLTEVLRYGPVHSRSKHDMVEYELQFFLVKFGYSPDAFLKGLSRRTLNVWIAQDELRNERRYRVSMLVRLLDATFAGGLSDIPFSSGIDFHSSRHVFDYSSQGQLELLPK